MPVHYTLYQNFHLVEPTAAASQVLMTAAAAFLVLQTAVQPLLTQRFGHMPTSLSPSSPRPSLSSVLSLSQSGSLCARAERLPRPRRCQIRPDDGVCRRNRHPVSDDTRTLCGWPSHCLPNSSTSQLINTHTHTHTHTNTHTHTIYMSVLRFIDPRRAGTWCSASNASGRACA